MSTPSKVELVVMAPVIAPPLSDSLLASAAVAAFADVVAEFADAVALLAALVADVAPADADVAALLAEVDASDALVVAVFA
jgi:hypothetical protein